MVTPPNRSPIGGRCSVCKGWGEMGAASFQPTPSAIPITPSQILPLPRKKRVVRIFLFVYNMAHVWASYPRLHRESERKEPKHGGYTTDFDRHGHLHGRGHRSGHHLRETGQRQFRRLLPGRAQPGPLGDRHERRGLGHVRLAADGAARPGLLVRHRRCRLDRHRPG